MNPNINQKWMFLEIINKFFLTKLKSYNLIFKLKFQVNFNLKIISVHYLILTFFSRSKTIILNKSKSNVICVLKQNSTKYSVNFLTKLNTESLFIIHKWLVNKTFLTINIKNIILFFKLEIFHNLLNITSKLYLNFFINGVFSQKVLIYMFRKILKFLKING